MAVSAASRDMSVRVDADAYTRYLGPLPVTTECSNRDYICVFRTDRGSPSRFVSCATPLPQQLDIITIEVWEAPAPGTLGIDRVTFSYRLRYDVRPVIRERFRWGRQVQAKPSIHVKTTQVGTVRVDYNPSRFYDAESSIIASADAARETLAQVFDLVSAEGLAIDHEAGGVDIVRIDLARDFSVSTPPAMWIYAALGTYAKNARKQRAFVARDGRLQTVTSGSKDLNLTLYDKAAHRIHDQWAQRHNLRFEAQLKSKRACRKYGLARPTDLNEKSVYEALLALWYKSRYEEIRLRRSAAEVIEAFESDPERRAHLLGAYTATAERINMVLSSRSGVMRDLRKCGLLDRRSKPTERPPIARLDFPEGREREYEPRN